MIPEGWLFATCRQIGSDWQLLIAVKILLTSFPNCQDLRTVLDLPGLEQISLSLVLHLPSRSSVCLAHANAAEIGTCRKLFPKISPVGLYFADWPFGSSRGHCQRCNFPPRRRNHHKPDILVVATSARCPSPAAPPRHLMHSVDREGVTRHAAPTTAIPVPVLLPAPCSLLPCTTRICAYLPCRHSTCLAQTSRAFDKGCLHYNWTLALPFYMTTWKFNPRVHDGLSGSHTHPPPVIVSHTPTLLKIEVSHHPTHTLNRVSGIYSRTWSATPEWPHNLPWMARHYQCRHPPRHRASDSKSQHRHR